MRWSRVVMYRWAQQVLDFPKLDVLEVSPAQRSFWRENEAVSSYRYTSFPETDICLPITVAKLPAHPDRHDLVVLDNVLEHVSYPGAALQNICDWMRSGDLLFVATPFMIKQHPQPVDLWRWTKKGLTMILESTGFEVGYAHAWGNRECAIESLLSEWPEYDPVRHAGRMRNEEDCPVMVWALAVKP